jgi:hypothetical protein
VKNNISMGSVFYTFHLNPKYTQRLKVTSVAHVVDVPIHLCNDGGTKKNALNEFNDVVIINNNKQMVKSVGSIYWLSQTNTVSVFNQSD